jgi:segregation and condensation protein A
VREQAGILVERLRRHRTSTFRALVHDCPDTLTVVARFLALLELYRESAVVFEQLDALAELTVRWTGTEEGELTVDDEFDVSPQTDDDEGSGDGAEVAETLAVQGLSAIDLTEGPAWVADVTDAERQLADEEGE